MLPGVSSPNPGTRRPAPFPRTAAGRPFLRACSALSANLRIEKGYVVHGTSRDGALARLDGLILLGIADLITLRSLSPADFQSVAQVIEAVAADEIYNLSGQSSVTLSFAQPVETLTGIALGTLNMLEPAASQSRPSAPNETAPSSFWQMISQDRANHDNPQRYFSAEITHM